ncbi:hypothetical protein VOLCADRAFT_108220 [Volvox carteri f. nagariensis]|uniref:Uncharacterized protein n=1 Tax=Volvox carteri f. nagariensis TaxID=3068 RepID=D8UIY3_VOLCA|nr:uncharacterized protein VOLCADRAFT_108220 [Volvox carteri f. nagariensis]EFJ40296.1 hypothetical protein VOLCADRAFT_108220 [Volvox carteri f. nagariensis]|eukprot:XP_002958630.1 hypothetical protein VOLCADRAFT_108220 [Volvox carteri f. nagariensis]
MLKALKKLDLKEVDREILALRREEEKLIREIKAAAKAGNTAGARVLAKSLVRLRGQISKLQGSSAHLRGISAQITTAAATTSVAKAVGSATKAMTAMQSTMKPAAVAASMAAFSRENQRLDMVGEVIGDALEGALDTDGLEEETGELVGQVLDEIGIDLAASLKETAEEDDLLVRLATLKS